MSEEHKVEITTPELETLRRVDLLANKPNEVLSELSDVEIIGVAALRALHERVIEIPATMAFVDNVLMLRGSKDRQGRRELLMALRPTRHITLVKPTYHVEEGGEEFEERARGFLSRIFKRR